MLITNEIWVKHPMTGQEINVAPLLNALDSFDSMPDSPLNENAAYVIRRMIRVLNLTRQDPALNPPGLIIDVYQDLHRLEDMFSALSVRYPIAA